MNYTSKTIQKNRNFLVGLGMFHNISVFMHHRNPVKAEYIKAVVEYLDNEIKRKIISLNKGYCISTIDIKKLKKIRDGVANELIEDLENMLPKKEEKIKRVKI